MEDPWNDSNFYIDEDGVPRRKHDPLGTVLGWLLIGGCIVLSLAALVAAGYALGGQ